MKTLCAPTPRLACFGCCPPIRPAHYDALDFARSLRRELLDNRRRLQEEGPRFRPIVGYSCWGLGFLDPEGRRAGCMLHPFQNGGKELRALIDYGDKCRRESCLPSRMFALLPEAGQDFWLPMAAGLNTFLYSSPRGNPLFHLMLWGPSVLEPLRKLALERGWTETELLHRHRFLLDPFWQPQGARYLFRLVLDRFMEEEPGKGSMEDLCRELWQRVVALPEVRRPGATSLHAVDRVYTHRLPLEDDFRDFLRLGLQWEKVSLERARSLEEQVEQLACQVVRTVRN